MKKRRVKKRHRPILPQVPPIVYDGVYGEQVGEDQLDMLQKKAELAVSCIQLGSRDAENYFAVLAIARSLYSLSVCFEDASRFQLLAVLAYAIVRLLQDAKASEGMGPEHIAAACKPLQSAVDVWFEMARGVRRSTVLASLRKSIKQCAALPGWTGHLWLVDAKAAGDEGIETAIRTRGFTWWDGEIITGYLDRQAGRLFYADVKRGAKLVVDKPTFVFITDKNDKVDPEALGLA